MAIVKIVPMPGPGGDGTPVNTGNFVFNNNEMSTNEEMVITVNTVPGSITASAYNGLELQFADAPGAGLRFPDGSIQTTAYAPSESFIPLPEFLSYDTGRYHLPSLNTNFGWDAEGLWFGYSGEGTGTSYPVFTNFTINGNDAVTVEFNVDIQDECSDIGLCVYLDEDTPEWNWGTHGTRIAAQFDCLMPTLLGLTEEYQGERSNIPNPGMYHVRFTYNPIGGTPVQFEYFEGTTTDTLINSMTLNETLGAGSYRVGFASDNNDSRTYISDLSIMVNEDTPYTDTLQNGTSGASIGIADFVFDTISSEGTESRMTIHNHDMVIRTTRDANQDSDIDINSADDVWITANDTVELMSTTDEIRLITGAQGQNTWHFTPLGSLQLPTTNSAISSGVDGDYVIDQRSLTAATDYSAGTPEFTDRTSFIVYTDADSQWFVANTPSVSNRALITFADLSTVTTIAVYDTNQEPAGVVFQWDAPLTKTAQDVWPLTISGTATEPRNYTALDASDAQWRFLRDGTVQFPGQDSNNRTGNGEVLQFGNPNQQSIITGSKPTLDNPTAQRLVVAGQDGVDGTNYDGEGGDIYLWAGVGGGTTGTGGDIKVDAGNGSLNGGGGTVKVRGGYSTNGNGGFIDIYAGDSSMASGGNVNIAAGTNQSVSEAVGGSVYIYGGGSADANAGGTVGLYTYQNGKIILSGDGGEFLNDASNPNNQIATLGDITSGGTGDITFSGVRIIGAGTAAGDGSGNGTIELVPDADLETSQYLIIDPTYPNHIHIRPGGQQDESNSDLILGGEITKVHISDGNRSVTIGSKRPQQSMAHMNYSSAPEYLDTTDVVTADNSGWTVEVNGIKYPIVSVQDLGGGITRIYAPGAPFVYEGVYNVFSPAFTNEWNFNTDGTLNGPGDSNAVRVSGIQNAASSNHLSINSSGTMSLDAAGGDMNFYMDGGMYIGASDSNNQIIKRSDLNVLPNEYFQSVRWTPNFTATGLTFTGTDNTHPAYNSYYVKQGQLVSFWIAIDCATVTSFGTGQLKVDLPFAPLPGTMNHFSGWVNVDETANPDLAGHMIVNADHLANVQTLDLHYVKSAGGANSAVMEAQLIQGTPATLTTLTNIYINGTYIADA